MATNLGRSVPDGLSSATPIEPVPVSPLCASIPSAWPSDLTDDLRGILGMMCFEFIALANVFRAAGFDIPKGAEDEQAFFLHRLLGFWFQHGPNWRKAAGEDLRSVRASAQAISTGTAETAKLAQGDACERGADRHAPTPHPHPEGSSH